MTNNRPVYILPFVNYNVYWPIISNLYCMTSFLLDTIRCFDICTSVERKKLSTCRLDTLLNKIQILNGHEIQNYLKTRMTTSIKSIAQLIRQETE